MNKKYTYKGAVYAYDKLVEHYWESSTWARSERKAVSNLKHQYRKFAGMINRIPITFQGKVIAS